MILSLLGQTNYSDNLWVQGPDGSPMMNYDFAPQMRALTDASFKFFFNALVG